MKRYVKSDFTDIECVRSYSRSPYSYASHIQADIQGLFKSLNKSIISKYFDEDALTDALDTLNKGMSAFKDDYAGDYD